MAVKHYSAQEFEQEVAAGEGLKLVDFWADWCGPCKMLAPVLEELAADLEGIADVGKVNIDEESDLASRFSVMSIPTVILFRDGEEVNRVVGFVPKQRIRDMVDQAQG